MALSRLLRCGRRAENNPWQARAPTPHKDTYQTQHSEQQQRQQPTTSQTTLPEALRP